MVVEVVVIRSTFVALRHTFCMDFKDSDKKPIQLVQLLLLLVPLVRCRLQNGIIKLETLSWFGSIARRYGLDDERSDGVTSVGGVGPGKEVTSIGKMICIQL